MTGLLGIDIWLSSDLSHTVLWFYCKPLHFYILLSFLSPLDEADRGNISFDLPVTNRDQDIASYSHVSQEMGLRTVHTHLAGFKPIK